MVFVLTASIEYESTSSTRTVFDQDGISILWTVGDRIIVFTDSERNGALFESTEETQTIITVFKGLLDISGISYQIKLFAVYPYSAEASFYGTSITTSLA